MSASSITDIKSLKQFITKLNDNKKGGFAAKQFAMLRAARDSTPLCDMLDLLGDIEDKVRHITNELKSKGPLALKWSAVSGLMDMVVDNQIDILPALCSVESLKNLDTSVTALVKALNKFDTSAPSSMLPSKLKFSALLEDADIACQGVADIYSMVKKWTKDPAALQAALESDDDSSDDDSSDDDSGSESDSGSDCSSDSDCSDSASSCSDSGSDSSDDSESEDEEPQLRKRKAVYKSMPAARKTRMA